VSNGFFEVDQNARRLSFETQISAGMSRDWISNLMHDEGGHIAGGGGEIRYPDRQKSGLREYTILPS
jgi:hypothetical protein